VDISKIKKVRAVVNLRTDKKLYPIGTLFEAPFTPDIEAEVRSGSGSLQVEETVSGPVAPVLSQDPSLPLPETPKRRGRKPASGKTEETGGQNTAPDEGSGILPGHEDGGPAPDPGDEI